MAALWRASLFGVYGLREFTLSGYQRHAQSFLPTDLDVSLTGQVAVVTGANSGIGYEIAKELWKRGAIVYMVCRNEERGTSARETIIAESGLNEDTQAKERLKLSILDVSRPKQISTFAMQVFGCDALAATPPMESFTPLSRLDILVNNAGVLLNDRQITPDGIEAGFATNVLGTTHLTLALVPVLEYTTKTFPDTAPTRVINVTSGGAYNAKLSKDDLESAKGTYNGNLAYSLHKRIQIELTQLWGQKYKDIHFSVMHPGWASTPGVDKSLPSFANKMDGRLRTAAQGADTAVWLALKKRGESGQFWFDRDIARRHLWGAGTETTGELSEQVESICKEYILKAIRGDEQGQKVST